MSDPLYLTFDDGPDPDGTPAVLEALARHDAQATFFVLGVAVRRRPDLIDEIRRAGHRIELHGDAHLDHRRATAQELVHDTGLVTSTLAEHGITPVWWRLPWGRPGRATAPLAAGLRLRVVGWDVDTHDWRGDDWEAQPEGTAERVARGGVVLMHDGFGPGATRDAVRNTVDLIDGLAAAAAGSGTPLLALPGPGQPSARAITDQAGAPVEARPAARSWA